jgi:hypothetical protein
MSFGAAMDVDGLVEGLCVKPGDTGDAALAVEEGGVSSVEAMLTAVYWMYRNVYWRHTNRGFMAAVKFAFQMLIESKRMSFDEYKTWVYGRSDWDALAYIHGRLASYATEAGLDIYNPLSSILEFNRFGYKRVFSLGSDNGRNGDLYHKVISKVSPIILQEIVEEVNTWCSTHAKVRPGDVLVDIPLKKRFRDAMAGEDATTEPMDTPAEVDSRRSMWVKMRSGSVGGRWQDLHRQSPLAAMLSEVEDHSGRKIRIFLSRELAAKPPQQSLQEGLVHHIYGVLKRIAAR